MGLFGDKCVRCDSKRTKKAFEGLPTCDDCERQLLADREELRPCPIDSTPMNKEVLMKVIIDRCPNCNGVWLDGGELDVMKQGIAEENFAAAFVTGMAVG